MQRDQLDTFIDNILAEKKLTGVSDEVRVQLAADLRESLLDQINRALIAALPETSLQGFNEILDNESATQQEMQDYIVAQGVNVQQITLDTMLRFAELYLGDSAKKD